MTSDILKLNYYQLFELVPTYIVNASVLQQKMRSLQQLYHPDNHVEDENMNTMAIAISSHINTAYNTLLDPLARAIYLLGIYGINVDLVHDTKFSHEFLFQQIELREAIAEAKDSQDIDKLESIELELKNSFHQLEVQITYKFTQEDYSIIIEDIKQLSFYNKLLKLINDILCEI